MTTAKNTQVGKIMPVLRKYTSEEDKVMRTSKKTYVQE